MIKIENVNVYGFEEAIRGMRNPMNSWNKSDSYKTRIEDVDTLETADYEFFVGDSDLKLMKNLVSAGSDHRKFMRFITVTMDVTAPFYWWKEFDTYKVGTVANSCSTMHKIAEREFTLDDFSHERLDAWRVVVLENVIKTLNDARIAFSRENLPEKKQEKWWQMIQLLPSGYNQRRTVMLNYEVLANMCRKGRRLDHKLDEWRDFCKFCIDNLPYSELFYSGVKND